MSDLPKLKIIIFLLQTQFDVITNYFDWDQLYYVFSFIERFPR